jgi:hypothetical protein
MILRANSTRHDKELSGSNPIPRFARVSPVKCIQKTAEGFWLNLMSTQNQPICTHRTHESFVHIAAGGINPPLVLLLTSACCKQGHGIPLLQAINANNDKRRLPLQNESFAPSRKNTFCRTVDSIYPGACLLRILFIASCLRTTYFSSVPSI